ncbi:zinc finger C2HC domain-containing protein 1C [Pelobates fuscus]|uniref:zinc finger C2HC domain-containing protein 1C n=1 Tax=Pelobates fuscus TaxID=191477 RepID=UPI002FE45113
MARLKGAPSLYEGIADAKFPTLKSELQPSKLQSRLEVMRNDFQERAFREREQKLLSLVKHETSAPYNHAEKRYTFHQSPGSHSAPWTAEEKSWASNWTVSKRSAGIDRAHPLEPVIYRKSPAQIPSEFNNMQRSSSVKVTGTKHHNLLPRNIRSNSGPTQAEPWLELQKTESSLEAEIRRKQALLREKLRRTEEELRRIQREKEEATQREIDQTQKKTVKNYYHLGNRSDLDEDYRSYRILKKAEFKSSPQPKPLPRAPSPKFTEDQHPERMRRQMPSAGENARKRSTQPILLKHAEEVSGSPLLRTTYHHSDRHTELSSDAEDELPAESELVPCQSCGRRFMVQRLEKHAQVCEKMQSSKRKVFDSSKARAKGTELEQYLQLKGKPSSREPQQVRNNAWRQKHETFLRTIRQARTVQQVIAKGGKPSDVPPPPPDENPDYITCPHCSRRFAPRAAERHIPKCETIKSKPRPPPQRRR